MVVGVCVRGGMPGLSRPGMQVRWWWGDALVQGMREHDGDERHPDESGDTDKIRVVAMTDCHVGHGAERAGEACIKHDGDHNVSSWLTGQADPAPSLALID